MKWRNVFLFCFVFLWKYLDDFSFIFLSLHPAPHVYSPTSTWALNFISLSYISPVPALFPSELFPLSSASLSFPLKVTLQLEWLKLEKLICVLIFGNLNKSYPLNFYKMYYQLINPRNEDSLQKKKKKDIRGSGEGWQSISCDAGLIVLCWFSHNWRWAIETS